jgi:hypothetical protein
MLRTEELHNITHVQSLTPALEMAKSDRHLFHLSKSKVQREIIKRERVLRYKQLADACVQYTQLGPQRLKRMLHVLVMLH